MEQLELYVYKCSDCSHREVLSSESVAPPEAHVHGTERVYCGNCEEDRDMEFLGLEGLREGEFVLDYETEERYCPLCEGACEED